MSWLDRHRQLLMVILALLAASSMWFYARRIAVPQQKKDALALDRPRGNLSDLYPRWLGARELLLHGRDPYSREITLEIQRGYYGRELDPSRPNDPKDESGFAYPLFVVFLLAPIIRMEFGTVRLLFEGLLAVLTVLSVLFWESALSTRVSRLRSLAVIFLVLGSYAFIEADLLQQLVLLVAFLLAASFWARQRGWLFLSGVLLAVATIKPQVALFPVLLMLLWVSGDWSGRRRWFGGFGSTLLALLAASEYLSPGWLPRFVSAVRAYRGYMAGEDYSSTPFLDLLLTPRWGGVGRGLIALLVLWVCWRVRLLAPDTTPSGRAVCVVLVGAVCIAPNLGIYNQILLLPGLLFAFAPFQSLWRNGSLVRGLRSLLALLLAWSWVACGILVVARFAFRADRFVERAWQLPLYTTLALPVVLLALLCLPVRAESPA